MKESVEEFIARGGIVNRLDNGGKQTATASQLTKNDKRLVALKQLLKDVDGNQDAELKVQSAIELRCQALRACQ